MKGGEEKGGESIKGRGEEWHPPLFYPIFSLSMGHHNRSGEMEGERGGAGRITVNLSLINLSKNKGLEKKGGRGEV